MLSAMHASMEFMKSCRGRRCRPREANRFPYKKSKTEFRRRPAPQPRQFLAAERVYLNAILARPHQLRPRHRLRREDDRRAVASFRQSRAICFASARFVCRPIFIEGRLQLDTWDDKQSGQKRSKLRVIGETMQLLGGRPPDAGGGATEGAEGARESRPSKPAPPPKAGAAAEPDDDEIPF